jgi:hypothetical protein
VGNGSNAKDSCSGAITDDKTEERNQCSEKEDREWSERPRKDESQGTREVAATVLEY